MSYKENSVSGLPTLVGNSLGGEAEQGCRSPRRSYPSGLYAGMLVPSVLEDKDTNFFVNASPVFENELEEQVYNLLEDYPNHSPNCDSDEEFFREAADGDSLMSRDGDIWIEKIKFKGKVYEVLAPGIEEEEVSEPRNTPESDDEEDQVVEYDIRRYIKATDQEVDVMKEAPWWHSVYHIETMPEEGKSSSSAMSEVEPEEEYNYITHTTLEQLVKITHREELEIQRVRAYDRTCAEEAYFKQHPEEVKIVVGEAQGKKKKLIYFNRDHKIPCCEEPKKDVVVEVWSPKTNLVHAVWPNKGESSEEIKIIRKTLSYIQDLGYFDVVAKMGRKKKRLVASALLLFMKLQVVPKAETLMYEIRKPCWARKKLTYLVPNEVRAGFFYIQKYVSNVSDCVYDCIKSAQYVNGIQPSTKSVFDWKDGKLSFRSFLTEAGIKLSEQVIVENSAFVGYKKGDGSYVPVVEYTDEDDERLRRKAEIVEIGEAQMWSAFKQKTLYVTDQDVEVNFEKPEPRTVPTFEVKEPGIWDHMIQMVVSGCTSIFAIFKSAQTGMIDVFKAVAQPLKEKFKNWYDMISSTLSGMITEQIGLICVKWIVKLILVIGIMWALWKIFDTLAEVSTWMKKIAYVLWDATIPEFDNPEFEVQEDIGEAEAGFPTASITGLALVLSCVVGEGLSVRSLLPAFQLYNHGKPFFESLYENMKDVINYIMFKVTKDPKWKDTRPITQLNNLHSEYNQFCMDYPRWRSSVQELDKVMPAIKSRYIEALELERTLVGATAADRNIALVAGPLFAGIKADFRDSIALDPRYKARREPVVLWLESPPKQGKSESTKVIMQAVYEKCRAQGLKIDGLDLNPWSEGDYWAQPEGSDYHDGYANQFAIIMEEMFNVQDKTERSVQGTKFLGIANHVPYPCNMSKAEDKGRFFLKPRVVCVSTNFKDWNNTGMTDVGAVLRRQTFAFNMKLKEKYDMQNVSLIDLINAWEFHPIDRSESKPELKDRVHDCMIPVLALKRPLTFVEVVDFMAAEVMRIEKQKLLGDPYAKAIREMLVVKDTSHIGLLTSAIDEFEVRRQEMSPEKKFTFLHLSKAARVRLDCLKNNKEFKGSVSAYVEFLKHSAVYAQDLEMEERMNHMDFLVKGNSLARILNYMKPTEENDGELHLAYTLCVSLQLGFSVDVSDKEKDLVKIDAKGQMVMFEEHEVVKAAMVLATGLKAEDIVRVITPFIAGEAQMFVVGGLAIGLATTASAYLLAHKAKEMAINKIDEMYLPKVNDLREVFIKGGSVDKGALGRYGASDAIFASEFEFDEDEFTFDNIVGDIDLLQFHGLVRLWHRFRYCQFPADDENMTLQERDRRTRAHEIWWQNMPKTFRDWSASPSVPIVWFANVLAYKGVRFVDDNAVGVGKIWKAARVISDFVILAGSLAAGTAVALLVLSSLMGESESLGKGHKHKISSSKVKRLQRPNAGLDAKIGSAQGNSDQEKAWRAVRQVREVNIVGDKCGITAHAFVSGMYAFINAHIGAFVGSVRKVEFKAEDEIRKTQTGWVKEVKIFPDRDLMRLTFDSAGFNANPSAAKLLRSKSRPFPKVSRGFRIIREKKGNEVLAWAHEIDKLTYVKGVSQKMHSINADGSHAYWDAKEYFIGEDMPGISGWCGFPYISRDDETEYLMGVHFGTVAQDCLVVPIYKEDLEGPGNVDPIMPIAYCQADERLRFDPMELKPEGLLIKKYKVYNGFEFLGDSLTNEYMPTETAFQKSPIYSSLEANGHVYTEPAVLYPCLVDGEKYDPSSAYFNKHRDTPDPKTDEFYEFMRDNPERCFEGFVDMELMRGLKPITLEEAIEGYDQLNILPRDSSMTLDFRHMKGVDNDGKPLKRKQLFEISDDGKCVGVHDELRQGVQRLEDAANEGHPVVGCTTLAFKDEPLLIEKKYCPRGFDVFSLICSLWALMYFAPIINVLKKHRHRTPSAVGINPMSKEWTLLYDYLNEIPGSNYMSCDFSKWDMSLRRMVAYCMGVWACACYGVSITSQLGKKLINVAQSGNGAFVVYMCHLLRKACGVDSGWILTTLINTFGNYCLHKGAFEFLKDRHDFPNVFSECVRSVHYGDDGVLKVSSEAPWFNMEVLQIFFLDYCGMVYTTCSKEKISRPYMEMKDIDFLCRRFVRYKIYGVQYVFCPLSMASIYGMLAWIRKGSDRTITKTMQLKINIKTALMEMFFHGPELYDKFVEEISECLNEHGIGGVYFPPYSAWLTKYITGHLCLKNKDLLENAYCGEVPAPYLRSL